MRLTFTAAAAFCLVVVLGSRIERDLIVVPSAFNGSVRVSENFRGVRFLRFGSDTAVQSYYDTRDPAAVLSPYVRVSLQALDRGRPVRRILVIGMGGGVQGMAARRAYPDAWIDLVDIDPVVVELAGRFMGFRPDRKMRPHVDDGAAFVRQVVDPYDVIFLDAFNGVDPPENLTTVAFFRAVAASLAPGGIVAVNVVYSDVSAHYDGILSRLRQIFGTVRVQTVPGGPHNRVVFCRSPKALGWR